MVRVMKDSGIAWIGDIPEGWDTRPLKALLEERKENNKPIKTDYILSLTIDRGVIPYDEKGSGGNKSKEDLSAYKLAYPNDIVLNSMNVIVGSVGLSKYFGAVSPVYYVLYPRNEDDYVEYYNNIFQAKVFQDSLIGLGNGIMVKQSASSKKINTIRMRIPMSKLNTVVLPYPPPEEQRKIADYLDYKCVLIDSTIEKQKTVIEKLKAYKQSVITEAVTKGLDPTVKMKPSGIEWIGNIPEGWEVRKLKNVGEAIIGLTYSPEEVADKGTLVLRSSNIQNGKIVFDDNVYVDKIIQEKLIVKKGDILICSRNGSRALVGKCAYIDEATSGHTFGAFMTVFRSVYNRFFFYVFNSAIFSFHIGTFLTSTINQLTTSNLNGIQIPLPPLSEQQAIAEFLDTKCTQIDGVIESKQKLIDKLADYKKSLIYECVTGKKEVV
ncbi:MAG: restriction endonuclease subunit S [Bacillota bacterium]